MSTPMDEDVTGRRVCLSQLQKSVLYNTKKREVVRVSSYHPHRKHEHVHGGGIVMNKNGLILTLTHLVPQNWIIKVRSSDDNDDQFLKAKFVSKGHGNNLALVQIEKPQSFNGHPAELVDEYSTTVGQEIFSIFHNERFYYSFKMGHVASVDRPTSELRKIEGGKDVGLELYKNVTFFQMNNVHGGLEAAGCPIFDIEGKLIGIYAFYCNGFDFGLPISFVNDFWRSYNENKRQGESLEGSSKIRKS